MSALAVYSSLLLKLETIRNFLNFKHSRQPDVCYDTDMLAYVIVLKSRQSWQNKEMLMISTLRFHHFLFALLLFPLHISMMLTYSQIRVYAIYFSSVVLSCDRTMVRWKLQPSTYMLSNDNTALRLHYICHWLKNKYIHKSLQFLSHSSTTVQREIDRKSRIQSSFHTFLIHFTISIDYDLGQSCQLHLVKGSKEKQ